MLDPRRPPGPAGQDNAFRPFLQEGAPYGGRRQSDLLDLETADPPALADFYHELLGWDIIASDPGYAVIGNGSSRIRFGRVEGYQGPGWPDSAAPKRYHWDLEVDDVAKAVERCLELGASKPEFQPGGDVWTVLTDPAGHPFCLCPAQGGSD